MNGLPKTIIIDFESSEFEIESRRKGGNGFEMTHLAFAVDDESGFRIEGGRAQTLPAYMAFSAMFLQIGGVSSDTSSFADRELGRRKCENRGEKIHRAEKTRHRRTENVTFRQ
jgi:hypothetical protein